MSSLFRFVRREEPESRWKILRGRRRLPPFSPYRQPLALPAPQMQAEGSPNWFRSLISGAGKLISSVLDSDDSGSSPSQSSSAYPSDEDYGTNPSDFEDHSLFKDITGCNEIGSMTERNVESLAVVLKSESKLFIEQLLMQETFSRDECNKLLEIIQSRVVCTQSEVGEGIQNEIPKRFCTDEAITPDLRKKAILETKKWFEEKGLSPSVKFDQECGPCILNTEMSTSCFDSYGGSPIEMAKSYLQCLPPWRSPSFSSAGFMSLPENAKFTSNTQANMLTTSKDLKTDCFGIGSLGSDENGIVFPKSSNNGVEESSKFWQKELSANLSVYNAPKTSFPSEFGSMNEGNPTLTSSIYSEPPSDASIAYNARRPQDGSKMKSIERMLHEHPSSRRVYRRVKKVVSSSRGRRRGN